MKSKELAEEYAALYPEDYFVEEFPILDRVPIHVSALSLHCYVGGKLSQKIRERIRVELEENSPGPCHTNTYFNQFSNCISVYVCGTDYEQVRKTFAEHHAQALLDIKKEENNG